MTVPFASQHTPTFPLLLQHLGVSVFVSTYQAGQLIILRAEGEVLNTHFCTLDKPMGLAVHQNQLAVGTAYQLWEYANLPAVADKVVGVLPHDACYLPRRLQVTGDIDIHELAYADDGELWLVNTRMSCLCTLDAAYSVVPRWRPPFITAYDLTDRCHLNGLAMKDGKPAFVSALGQSDTAVGWRDNKAAGGVLMTVSDGKVLADGLSMPHSPRWYQGQLWYLESGAGQLCTMELASGVKTVIAELPGFTRGLDFCGQYAFIGLSQVRETAVFAGLPLTARAGERHCGVWVVDISSGATVACVAFTGSVQEVFAVVVVPQRFPVILDMDDPLVRSSYALPDAALAEVVLPDPIAAAFEQATFWHGSGDLEQAIASYQHLLAEAPQHIAARYQLGLAFSEQHRWQAAADELAEAVAAEPHHAEAHNCLGLCHAALHNWDKSLWHFGQALAADVQYATAHVNRALVLLKLGHWQAGFAEYEWRLQLAQSNTFVCPQPRWQGEVIADQTVLVHSEFGDAYALLFARFLPLLAARCRKLIVACSAPLHPLLEGIPGVAEVRVNSAMDLDGFDCYCPLLSLPFLLGVTLDNLPKSAPYLSLPNHIPLRSLPDSKQLRVGWCWTGSPQSAWLPLLANSNAQFYSLQMPVNAEETQFLAENGVINLAPDLSDYAQAAAFIQALDLVISTDTAMAHLAGAIAKPTWVLTEVDSAWYWLQDGNDSPLYQSLTLFRWQEGDDWQSLLARVGLALAGFIAAG